MRRADREISSIEEIVAIIEKCDVCRIALFDEEYPYIVPLNFGYMNKEDTVELYFHGANEGKKISLISQNNNAGFEMDCAHKLIIGEKACDYTMEYESVMGSGRIEILSGDEKMQALIRIMNQYSKVSKHEFHENHVKAVAVFKLVVNKMTGKRLKR